MAIWDKILSTTEKDKKKAQEMWNRASRYFESRLYNRALQDLQEALMLDPGLMGEAQELMQMFTMQGLDEQALSVGLALIKLEPNNFELMNKLANTLRNLNSFDRAKKLYTRILKEQPNHQEAKYNLAACSFRITTADNDLIRQTKKVEGLSIPRRYVFQGYRKDFYEVPNPELEEDEKEKKAKAKKDDDKKLSAEDKALIQEGKIAELNQDVTAAPTSWEAQFNMGLLYDVLGRGDLALQHYRQAMAIEPANVMSGNNLAVLLMEQNPQEAESLLLQMLDKDMYNRAVIYNLALLYRRTNKAFQTLRFYVYAGDLLRKSMWRFDTQYVEEYARNLYERRKYLEAVPQFENLAQEKKDTFWLEKLVVMYFNQKKEDEYVRTLKRLIKVDPNQLEAQTKLTELAMGYEKTAMEKYNAKSRGMAIPAMVKAIHIQETADRWATLAQWYEEEGEEILADNALRRWKSMMGMPDTPPAAPQPLSEEPNG